VIALVGGSNGCFGGMGIVARCTNGVVMSEEGRLAMSGPEVIETAGGVEEFDARDRALVWRTTGGKHRYLAMRKPSWPTIFPASATPRCSWPMRRAAPAPN
jgi:hypothetical protein